MSDTFHPLDPLSAEEFTTVAKILAQTHDVGASWRYTSVELSEPSKAEVAAFDNNGTGRIDVRWPPVWTPPRTPRTRPLSR